MSTEPQPNPPAQSSGPQGLLMGGVLLVILALLIGYELAGFLGILLSVPIAGAVQELVGDIDRRKARESVASEA